MKNWRPLIFGPLVVLSLLVASALSFSDRVLLEPVKASAWALAGAGRSAELALGLDLVSRDQIPGGPDALGHLLLWAVIGFVGGLGVAKLWSRAMVLAGLFAVSAVIEIAQPLLSVSRAGSLSDLMGNGIGIVVGGVVATAVIGATRRFGNLLRRQVPAS